MFTILGVVMHLIQKIICSLEDKFKRCNHKKKKKIEINFNANEFNGFLEERNKN